MWNLWLQFTFGLLLSGLPLAQGSFLYHENTDYLLERWAQKACRQVYTDLSGKSIISRFTVGRRLLQEFPNDPVHAYQELTALVSGSWDQFREQYPHAAYLLDLVTRSSISNSVQLMGRVHQILLAHSFGSRNGNSLETSYDDMAHNNEGIGNYLYARLYGDPIYLRSVLNFMERLTPADRRFREQLPHRDEYTVNQMLASQSQTQFDVIGQMITSVRSALPENQRNNPREISRYVHQLLLFFHDDTTHFHGRNTRLTGFSLRNDYPASHLEQAAQAVQSPPDRSSIMYTNWANLENPQDLAALRYLGQQMHTEHRGAFRMSSLRLGYYHTNAAGALHGLLFRDLYPWLPFRNRILSHLQGRMVAIYKRNTNSRYQNNLQREIRADIRRNHPRLARRLDGIRQSFHDVMGTATGDGGYQGGYFNNILQNESQFLALANRLGLTTNGRLSESARTELRQALVTEQLLMFQAYRTVQQHQNGYRLSQEINRRIRRAVSQP